MNVTMALILIFIFSFFGSFSTLLFKMGAGLPINFKNYKLGGAVFLAGFSFLFYLYALKQAPLTFIYLTASISYVWAILLAKYVLKEEINKPKIIGVVLLFIGIIILHV